MEDESNDKLRRLRFKIKAEFLSRRGSKREESGWGEGKGVAMS